MRVLLIIPAYNEEENIQKVINAVRGHQNETHPYTLDFIVIDDGSKDGTLRICREMGADVIPLIRNLGIGGAVQTGYVYALRLGYDAAVQFDGDGQHDIGSLERLLAPIMEGRHDFVVGSRFLCKDGDFKSTFARRAGIRFLSVIIRVFAGLKVSDPTSGYRAAGKRAVEFLARNYPVDYPEPESAVALHKNAFSIGEMPVNMFEREGGSSSIHSWKAAYYMFKVSLAVICASFQRRAGGKQCRQR